MVKDHSRREETQLLVGFVALWNTVWRQDMTRQSSTRSPQRDAQQENPVFPHQGRGTYPIQTLQSQQMPAITAATAIHGWFVTSKKASKTNLIIIPFTAKESCCISRPQELLKMSSWYSHECASGSAPSWQLCCSLEPGSELELWQGQEGGSKIPG